MSAAAAVLDADDGAPVRCPACGELVPGLQLPPGGAVRVQCWRRVRRTAHGRQRHDACGAWLFADATLTGDVRVRRIFRPRRARPTLCGQEESADG